MSKITLQKTANQEGQPRKLESDHSSVIEKDNAFIYSGQEKLVIKVFKMLNGLKELCKPENKKNFKIKRGYIIENVFEPRRNLVFSAKYIQQSIKIFPIEEITTLLNLLKIVGEACQVTDKEGVLYWGVFQC